MGVEVCERCHQNTIEPSAVFLPFRVLLHLVAPRASTHLFRDCGAGINLVGLLFTALLFIVGFIVLIART